MVLPSVEHPDYYEILGVPRNADAQAIKNAFHRLARRYHPDRSQEPGAEARFKEITEAYTVLSDPARRAEYDDGPRDALSDMRRADASRVPGHRRLFTFGLNPDDDFFIHTFINRRHMGDPAERGADIRLEVEVPLEAVAAGTEHTVDYSRLLSCPTCGGRGSRPGTFLRLCSTCGGVGRLATRTTCQQCGGTGLVVDEVCPDCAGGGLRPGREWLRVRIPAGVEDGAVLRVRGRGMPGQARGAAWGDLYLTVRSAPDPHLVRRGADLWYRASIPVAEAVLGTHLEVACLGQVVMVEVPPGTQPGALLRLAGHGLPRSSGAERGQQGDLCVLVDVVVPATLSSRERRLYEQLRGARRRSGHWPWRRKRNLATGTQRPT
jgi:molecular chaperone DnaJ